MKIYNGGNIVMNTYLYPIDGGYVMVDTGYEGNLRPVEGRLLKMGIKLEDVKYVFLTHAHDDHAGFLSELLDKYPQIKVIMSDKAMATLKRGQNSFDGGCSTFVAWIFCKIMGLLGKAEHRFPAIDDKLKGRFIEITEDNRSKLEKILKGEILFTPGHTRDSISLKIDNIVFCGDAAMNGFPSVNRFIIWIEDVLEFERSWNKLIFSGAELIYPAHGAPFNVNDLEKYKEKIKNIKLRSLK